MSVPIGSGLSDSQWVYPFSQLETKDLLARVIYAEDTKTTSGQAAVAQVLRNRYDNPDGYNFGHGGVNTWAMVVYKACSVAQGPNENAQRPNTNDSFWANALSLATKLVQNQSIFSTVGARYFWKSADAWPSYNADSTKVKVNVKSYLNSSGKGNYFHNNSETFILAIDYGNDADTKFAFMKIRIDVGRTVLIICPQTEVCACCSLRGCSGHCNCKLYRRCALGIQQAYSNARRLY